MAVITLSRFFLLAIALGLQSAMAWFLGPTGRGEYAVCLLFASVLSTIFLFGQDWAVSYFVSSGRICVDEAVSFSCAATMLSSILAVGVGWVLIHTPFEFFVKAPHSAFVVSLCWTASIVWLNSVNGLLRGMRLFTLLATLTVLKGVISLVGTIVLIQLCGWGVIAPITADMTGSLVLTVGALAILARKHHCRWRFPSKLQLRGLLDYGKRTYAGSLGMMTNTRIGTLLIALFASTDQIGMFALAMGLVSQLSAVPDLLGQVIQPRVAASREGRRELVALSCRIMCWFTATVLAVILVFCEPIVRFAFSVEFLPVCALMWIMAPGILLVSVAKCTYPYFYGTNRPGIVSAATSINVIVNAVALIALLPALGLPGAAWAVTIGYACRSVWLLWHFRRLSRLPLRCVLWPQRGDVLSVWNLFGPNSISQPASSLET